MVIVASPLQALMEKQVCRISCKFSVLDNGYRIYSRICLFNRLNVKGTTIRTRASFDPCLLCVAPISKTCANSFFDRTFVYAAPTWWNALDIDIRLLPFEALKKRVKTHLYLKYFIN